MNQLVQYLSFTPTINQKDVLAKMQLFLNQKDKNAFILSGAAGTGKTSITEALTNGLSDHSMLYSLCAPTGRAAKVISEKTKSKAITIHKQLYTLNEITDEDGQTVRFEFIPKENIIDQPVVFLIDESSMISNKKPNKEDRFVSANSLLFDLVKYMKSGHPDNKIVFIGDEYQLPPINSVFSPALTPSILENEFKLKTQKAYLTEIVRQESDSHILKSAIDIKKAIDEKRTNISFSYRNTQSLNGFLDSYLQKHLSNTRNTVLLAWKNARIEELNFLIRDRKYGKTTNILNVGEQLIATQNYYNGIEIHNGTFLRVHQILGMEDYHGFKFADVKLINVLTDKVIPEIIKISVDPLFDHQLSNDFSREKKLYGLRMKENRRFRETKDKKTDPYLSALKVQYGYAITVHKAQGGEWEDVFIYPEIPYKYDGGKWLYTAVTRASKEIYSFKN
jgi:ATP-dependent exoDNAse (exonuclease V) alpha subunit